MEAWRAIGDVGVDLLWNLMWKIEEQEQMPDEREGGRVSWYPSSMRKEMYKIAGVVVE